MFSFHIYALRRERWKVGQAAISTTPPAPGFREKHVSSQCPQKRTFFHCELLCQRIWSICQSRSLFL